MRASLVALLFLLCGCAGSGASDRPGRRPNVLFIAVDDLNDWVGCLGGHPQARTPNIDRLAARGMLFTNAHCSAPLCNPSRASVMSGLQPATNGVHGNQQDWRRSPHLKGHPLLGQFFREHGYWTGACGKIFHANHGGECAALNGGHGGLRGFNHPASWTERHPSKDRQLPVPAVLPGRNMNGLDMWHWDWGPIDVPDERTQDGRSVAWAVDQIGRLRDRPFFLAVGLYRPHGPWYVPRRYFDLHPLADVTLPVVKENDIDDIPRIATGYARGPRSLHRRVTEAGLWKSAVRAYLANISFADAMLGRVLDALDASPHRDNTVIVLWSDHGWHLGEKQRWHKSTHWEEATRVPLIVVAPGVTAPGGRCARAVSLVDLYPTLVDLCGIGPGPKLDGLTLRPLLVDPKAKRDRPAITTRAGKHHSVRDDRWRYIRYSDGSEELYDHANDPREWTNLAGRPEFDAAKKRLAAWIPRHVNVVNDPDKEHAEPGFRPMFNGYDLTGWKGEPGIWSVEDGILVGRTKARPGNAHTYLVWDGGLPGDFEMRFEYQVGGHDRADSGVNYRSRPADGKGPFALAGYQANFDAGQGGAGALYEIEGRKWLAKAGERVTIGADGARTVTGETCDAKAFHDGYDASAWQSYAIIARGNRLIHKVNGVTTADVTDNDEKGRAMKGRIGLQLHGGKPMVARFRNVRIRSQN